MPNPTASLDRRLMRHPDVYRRVVIPAAMKWEIREKLDQANINQRVLHGGLDGLSRWLARYYRPDRDLAARVRAAPRLFDKHSDYSGASPLEASLGSFPNAPGTFFDAGMARSG